MSFGRLALVFASTASVAVLAQAPTQPDWVKLQDETMRHYQALVRLDTRNPPGNEHLVADYLKGVLEKEGIPVQIVGSDPNRPNLVARLKGNGRKKPLLFMGHTDTVTVDEGSGPTRRSARRAKTATSTAAAPSTTRTTSSPRLMTMLMLKRLNVPLDRDVIFALRGRRGRQPRASASSYMANEHFRRDRCGVLPRRRRQRHAHRRRRSKLRDRCRRSRRSRARIELVVARHLRPRLGSAQDATRSSTSPAPSRRIGEWRPPMRLNETTAAYFKRLAAISPPEEAKRYRDVLTTRSEAVRPADDYLPRTSRATRRCCARRCRRTSSTAATAST